MKERENSEEHRRDTGTWYGQVASSDVVSASVFAFAATRSGPTVLDLGCGSGGYAARLRASGLKTVAADTNLEYAMMAAELGVPAVAVDGNASLPFPDDAFHTVLLLEVLEHLTEPKRLLKEALRVCSHNVLVTVPDCTFLGKLKSYGLTFDHMLETDHRNFFTRNSLGSVLELPGTTVSIEPGDHVDLGMARLHGGVVLAKSLALCQRLGLYRPRVSSRLFAELCHLRL
jgi:SAM-dependent methyltransferase